MIILPSILTSVSHSSGDLPLNSKRCRAVGKKKKKKSTWKRQCGFILQISRGGPGALAAEISSHKKHFCGSVSKVSQYYHIYSLVAWCKSAQWHACLYKTLPQGSNKTLQFPTLRSPSETYQSAVLWSAIDKMRRSSYNRTETQSEYSLCSLNR